MLFKAKNLNSDSLNQASTSRQVIQALYVLISLFNLATVLFSGYLIVIAIFKIHDMYKYFCNFTLIELSLIGFCGLVMSFIFYITIKTAFDDVTEPTLRVQLRVVLLSALNIILISALYIYLFLL